MKYRNISSIACKLMAVYLFFRGLNYIPSVVTMLLYSPRNEEFAMQFIPWALNCIILILVPVVLWTFSNKFSTFISKDINEEEKLEHDYSKVAIISFSTLGLFMLLNSLPDLLRYIVVFRQQLSIGMVQPHTNMYFDSLARIIGEAIRLILSIWLIIGAKGILKLIRGFRSLGMDRIESIEE